MDWKSTAVISGAGIMATWFFSMPAVHPPVAPTSAPVVRPAQSPESAIDIQQEAARLDVHVRPTPQYVETSRNPFSFAARSAPASVARPAGTSGPAPAAPVVPLPPPPPRITLDGIATDVVDGKEQRTAVLGTDAGVVLVHEGDQVAGQFTVGRIGADAVELVKTSDGSPLRLPLR